MCGIVEFMFSFVRMTESGRRRMVVGLNDGLLPRLAFRSFMLLELKIS